MEKFFYERRVYESVDDRSILFNLVVTNGTEQHSQYRNMVYTVFMCTKHIMSYIHTYTHSYICVIFLIILLITSVFQLFSIYNFSHFYLIKIPFYNYEEFFGGEYAGHNGSGFW